jgi:hypothetical protein
MLECISEVSVMPPTKVSPPQEYPDKDLAYFFEQKKYLFEFFYKLKPRQRFIIMKRETSLLFAYLIGYYAAWSFVKFINPSAYAQSMSPTHIFGWSKDEWSMLFHIVELGVVLILLVACGTHMLLARRPNQWVAKTGTFLLGFITKSLTAFP